MTSGEPPKVSHLDSSVTSHRDGTSIVLTPSGRNKDKPVEISARTGKPKRRKAVRACTNCQRTHLTCDDDRPCERCVKRGCADTCVDGERKKTKRTRVKGGASQSKADLSQYVPDLLMAQGQMTPLEIAQQPQHIPHLQHFPPPPGVPRALVSADELLSQATSPLNAHNRLPLQPMTLHGPHSHGHSHDPPSPPHRFSTPDIEGGYPNLSRFHPHEDSGPLSVAKHGHHIEILDDKIRSPPVESYGVMHEYFEHLDTFLFPSQPPLHRFTSEIQGATFNKKDGSVISAMLQSHNKVDDMEDPISDRHRGSTSNESGLEDVSNRHSVESSDSKVPVEHQGIVPWLEPTSNPLANAHNEHSRRFSYNYEHTDPSEVYRKVIEPFPNRKAFHQMIDYLKKRLDPSEFKNLVDYLTKLKSQFGSISRPLSKDDNLFVEQSFQRTLLEEEKQFALTPVPCLVWRRSGVVAAVSPRFSKLTQWPPDRLKSALIMQAMNTESICRYFEKYQPACSKHASEFKFECVLLTPAGAAIPTEAEVTIRRDLFNMPLTLVGKFWVK